MHHGLRCKLPENRRRTVVTRRQPWNTAGSACNRPNAQTYRLARCNLLLGHRPGKPQLQVMRLPSGCHGLCLRHPHGRPLSDWFSSLPSRLNLLAKSPLAPPMRLGRRRSLPASLHSVPHRDIYLRAMPELAGKTMSEIKFVRVDHHRRGLARWVGLLGIAPWFGSSALAAADDTSLQWTINESRVVSEGHEVVIDEGLMLQDLVIEGLAQALNTDFLPTAKFKLVLQAFSPAKDIGRQLAGRWYLKGYWTLNDPLVTTESKARQWNTAGALKSHFLAETAHDPRLASTQWRAEFSMLPGRYTPQDSKSPGFSVRGTGALAMNTGFEGTLSLALR